MTDSSNPLPPLSAGEVPLETWRRLYDLAGQMSALAPWKWMQQTDVFVVEDPGSHDPLLVSVLGMFSDFCGVAVYAGARAIRYFWEAQQTQEPETKMDMMLAAWQVQAVFDSKDCLFAVERKAIRALGLSFRRREGWPYFHSFRLGWHEWPVDAREALWIEWALENLLDVAPRFRDDPQLLGAGAFDRRYLFRTRPAGDSSAVWRDERRPCPPPAIAFMAPAPKELVAKVGALPDSGLVAEMDVRPLWVGIGERGERPRLPYAFILCAADSGVILEFGLITIDGDFESLWAQIPMRFLEFCNSRRVRPAELRFCRSWLSKVMAPLCSSLNIKNEVAFDIPAARRACEAIERDLWQGGAPAANRTRNL